MFIKDLISPFILRDMLNLWSNNKLNVNYKEVKELKLKTSY